ncbi:hypothetical protein Taro_002012 [Colocasia esculenta]|uniref:Uncharacterized protein n=1 Tax=Colocasia esculenta TaxID=4460 RepID=A0A843TKI2_COLES|nr:hypothetical protein [Colocasia esculenta]
MIVCSMIYQQVIEAQSPDVDLADVLQLPEVVLDEDSEVVLDSWTASSRALELGEGGVLAYEKALIGWIFVLSALSRHVLIATGSRVAFWFLVAIGETSQQFPPRRTEETGR